MRLGEGPNRGRSPDSPGGNALPDLISCSVDETTSALRPCLLASTLRATSNSVQSPRVSSMSMWLYQMDQKKWPPNSYRLDIWENERWSWPVGRKASTGSPRPGDTVVFFYAPTGGIEPGFYGWAVALDWHQDGRDRKSVV